MMDIEQVKVLILEALETDGAHHKQWYLWQIAAALCLDLSDEWSEDDFVPDDGIAP